METQIKRKETLLIFFSDFIILVFPSSIFSISFEIFGIKFTLDVFFVDVLCYGLDWRLSIVFELSLL